MKLIKKIGLMWKKHISVCLCFLAFSNAGFAQEDQGSNQNKEDFSPCYTKSITPSSSGLSSIDYVIKYYPDAEAIRKNSPTTSNIRGVGTAQQWKELKEKYMNNAKVAHTTLKICTTLDDGTISGSYVE